MAWRAGEDRQLGSLAVTDLELVLPPRLSAERQNALLEVARRDDQEHAERCADCDTGRPEPVLMPIIEDWGADQLSLFREPADEEADESAAAEGSTTT